MTALGKLMRRTAPVFVAILCIGGFLNGPNPATSAPPPGVALAPFAPINTIPNPFDTAGSPAGLFVTHCAARAVPTPEVQSLDTSGNPTLFATLAGTCADNQIAIAPAPTFSVLAPGFPTVNAAGFTSGFVYATVLNGKPQIYQLDPSGLSQSQFAIFDSATCGTLTGLTFDHQGAFGSGGGRLIAGCSSGQVWELCGPGAAAPGNPCAVNNAPQLLATVPISGTDVPEGPDIAPQCVAGITCLPGFAGQILIAVGSSSGSGKLFTVSNTGVVTAVVSTPSPESVAFVPHPKCTYAPANAQAGSSPVYFVADAANNTLDFLPLNVFTNGNFNGNPPGGNALVSTEGGRGITLVSTDRGKLVTSTFAASGSLQGSGFVDCSIPFPLTGLIARQDQTINLQTGSGVVTVDILANNGKFNPLTICVGNGFTADGSLPCPGPLNHAPTYGFKGGEQSFASCASKLTSSPSGLALPCKFTKSALDLPFDHFGGTLIMKLFYIGGGGDGDAEGGG